MSVQPTPDNPTEARLAALGIGAGDAGLAADMAHARADGDAMRLALRQAEALLADYLKGRSDDA